MQNLGKEVTGIDKRQYLAEIDEELLCADGFDDAILGICERACSRTGVAYDRDKCIEILVERDGMEYEEAIEYFEFNVVAAWSGEGTPVFISKIEIMDLTKA